MEFLNTNKDEFFDDMKLEGVDEERYKGHLRNRLNELFDENEEYAGRDDLKENLNVMIDTKPEQVEAIFKLLNKKSFNKQPYDEIIPEVDTHKEGEEGEPITDSENNKADENYGSGSSQ